MKNTAISTTRFDAVVTSIVVILIVVSGVMLLAAYSRGESLGTWIWQRHQNQFSWYSRPLFILPACYYAYRQKLWLTIGFMVLLGCSLFWFEAPQSVSEHVVRFLEWERQLFFTNESVVPLVLLIFVVIAFLFGLFYAFWQRNLWLGLLLINAGTIIKIVVSMTFGKEAGLAAVVPSLSSLAIINLVALAVWIQFQRTKQLTK